MTSIALLACLAGNADAQDIVRKEHKARRLKDGEVIRIDAKLEEPVWQEAHEVTGFDQLTPPTGKIGRAHV